MERCDSIYLCYPATLPLNHPVLTSPIFATDSHVASRVVSRLCHLATAALHITWHPHHYCVAEWLPLPVTYCDLPRNARLEFAIWDIYTPGKVSPLVAWLLSRAVG